MDRSELMERPVTVVKPDLNFDINEQKGASHGDNNAAGTGESTKQLVNYRNDGGVARASRCATRRPTPTPTK